ncbi:meteorin-like protein isoform X2 [Uloborus diversus]|uniref:meteorin-like protein isoform X2 n=1 Tax=Uloborus diversus TaxID=327109 RepID=UPI002408F25E|nr:meteorin-like protein isoform X2 [Uloborus diversus]
MLLFVFSTVFISIILILNNAREVCGHSSDACDWVGSGLHHRVPRGVQPLYLRCTRGHIKWHYPRGALRALLRPRLTNFQGCIRVSANSTGARLFLEGEKRLYPLYRADDGKPEDYHRCFTSRRGQVALYIEADPPLDILRKDVVEFSYDLVPQENLADDMEECRPCNDNEILAAYCTSDFIVQGTVSALSHNNAAQTSELSVRATAIKRDSPPKSWHNTKYVTLHRPLKCGTKAGMGEFLFLGRWRLSKPVIHCAPRLSHWKEIRRKALAEGVNQCQLD